MLRTVVVAGAHGEELDLLDAMIWDPHWISPSASHRKLFDAVARTAVRDEDPHQRVRLLELLASIPPDQEWMSESLAARLVDVQRLRSTTPASIQLADAPFDWEARLDEQDDTAGGLLRLQIPV